MSAQVIDFPRANPDRKLTYPELAMALGRELGVRAPTTRHLRHLANGEGMPDAGHDFQGRRVFLLEPCLEFVRARAERMGRTMTGDQDSPSRRAS